MVLPADEDCLVSILGVESCISISSSFHNCLKDAKHLYVHFSPRHRRHFSLFAASYNSMFNYRWICTIQMSTAMYFVIFLTFVMTLDRFLWKTVRACMTILWQQCMDSKTGAFIYYKAERPMPTGFFFVTCCMCTKTNVYMYIFPLFCKGWNTE